MPAKQDAEEQRRGWTNLDDTKAVMRNGFAYANVHTLANPAREIRGQIR